MDIIKLIKERHSVRQYKNKEIELEKQQILNELIAEINKANSLNIQIFYNESNCFNNILAHYGKFSGVQNYISLTGKKSPNLNEKLGYYGEKIVLKAQELGLNTCWVAMTHGKSKANVRPNEKEVCLISIGYGLNQGISHKNKAINKVSNYTEGMPDWFLKGVQSALLAPTAMNQQKFYFELTDNCIVKTKAGTGFYTKLDLGIAKYNLEIGSGKKF